MFTTPRRGATLIEFGLVVALVALIVIPIVAVLGGNVTDNFADADAAFAAPGSGGSEGGGSSVADFDASAPSIVFDEPLTFTATDPSATAWAWNFGDVNDPSPSTAKTTSHTYAYPGTYTVTLEATGPEGTETTTQEITVLNPATTSFTATLADNTVYNSDDIGTHNIPSGVVSVTFDASGSLGTITNYAWWFDDNGESSSGMSISHTFALDSCADQAWGCKVRLTVTHDGVDEVSWMTLTETP